MIFSIPFTVIIQSSWFDISYSLQSTRNIRTIRTLRNIGTIRRIKNQIQEQMFI